MLFDIAPSEMLLTVIVAVVVIGPKDLPLALRTAGRWMGKMRRVSGHFRNGIETMIREAELEEMEKKWRAQNQAILQAHPAAELGHTELAHTELAHTELGHAALGQAEPPAAPALIAPVPHVPPGVPGEGDAPQFAELFSQGMASPAPFADDEPPLPLPPVIHAPPAP